MSQLLTCNVHTVATPTSRPTGRRRRPTGRPGKEVAHCRAASAMPMPKQVGSEARGVTEIRCHKPSSHKRWPPQRAQRAPPPRAARARPNLVGTMCCFITLLHCYRTAGSGMSGELMRIGIGQTHLSKTEQNGQEWVCRRGSKHSFNQMHAYGWVLAVLLFSWHI